jgi:hypothetical protein
MKKAVKGHGTLEIGAAVVMGARNAGDGMNCVSTLKRDPDNERYD